MRRAQRVTSTPLYSIQAAAAFPCGATNPSTILLNRTPWLCERLVTHYRTSDAIHFVQDPGVTHMSHSTDIRIIIIATVRRIERNLPIVDPCAHNIMFRLWIIHIPNENEVAMMNFENPF